MYRYKKKKGKKKERRRNFSQFSCPQCSYLSETVLKCTTHYARILKDNPLGQSGQQTPMGIIRKVL